MRSERVDELLDLWDDGELTPDCQSELAALLLTDPDLRARAVRRLHTTALLTELLAPPSEATAEPAPRPRRRRRAVHVRGAAAVLALAASVAVALLVLPAGPAGIATVESAGGAVLFVATDGVSPTPLTVGRRVGPGTVRTESEDGFAVIRFDDGSRLAISGESEVAFDEDDGKRVRLGHGRVSAEVRPQPQGRPMVVRTPTATAEVLGTDFELTSDDTRTRLAVEQGRVRLRRLVDGAEVEVTARRSAVASLDRTEPLTPTGPKAVSDAWAADLAGEPPAWKGVWADGRVAAVPYVAGRDPNGGIVTRHGVAARTGPDRDSGRVAVAGGSSVTIRWRTALPAEVSVMLLTHRPSGGFGGNFEARLDPARFPPDADGWRRAVLPFADFVRIDRPSAPRNPVEVRTVLVSVSTAGHGLEVAALAIRPGDRSSADAHSPISAIIER